LVAIKYIHWREEVLPQRAKRAERSPCTWNHRPHLLGSFSTEMMPSISPSSGHRPFLNRQSAIIARLKQGVRCALEICLSTYHW